jgi:hypothetical protein
MSTPCNSLNVQLIKVSKLASYSALKGRDIILTIQSGSSLYSRKSTLNNLASFVFNHPSGSYSGSFSGSFKGKASGSFSGSFYGTATRSLTSSYLRQTNQNTTNGVGYYDGTRLTSAPGLVFDNNIGGAKSLSISSSLPFNFLKIASRGVTSGGTKYNQAGISLANYNSSEPYPTYDSWTLLSATSGSLTFIAPIGSNAFSSSTIKAQSTTGECYGMVQRRNGFYFWPYMVSNTPARDGAIGIGVQPPEEATGSFDKYLRAKLQINMFSGSGEGPWSVPATVENRATAILVNYGSSSAVTGLTKTFFVSGSGNTYIHGKLNVNRGVTGSFYGTGFKTLNGKSVSFWGTGSHAVSASYAKTASYFAGASAAGLIKSANSVQYSTQDTGTGTSWFDTGLTITITPNSSTTKFLINASIVLANGTAPGNAIAGLWKLQGGVYTALINQFTSVDGSTFDAQPSSTTYLDTAGSTTSRTYLVRVKADAVSSTWYTNRSNYSSATEFSATSAMTILEFLI